MPALLLRQCLLPELVRWHRFGPVRRWHHLLGADGGDTTPTAEGQTLAGSRSKQGSPFYAEPADALRQAGLTSAATAILRRQHRSQVLHASQRHSEPLKAGFGGSGNGALLQPSELEKMAGSLDELKPKPKVSQQQQQQLQHQHSQQQQPTKRARNLIDHWQLDSSWEFMAKQDQGSHAGGDYDTAAIDWQEKENSLGKKRTLTIHQIIANRLPDLNLPELVRCSTPPQTAALQPHVQGQDKVGLGCRLSSYDNVFCQNSFGGIDSAQSDDGTIFSEPTVATPHPRPRDKLSPAVAASRVVPFTRNRRMHCVRQA